MGLFDFLKKDKGTILGMDFPIFNGKKIYSYSGKTNKYERKDYYYKLDLEKQNNYIQTLYMNGFKKENNIKYTKYNGYVIIEELSGNLHIAFHVSK